MIKSSDIQVSVTKDYDSAIQQTVVHATYERHEVMTIHPKDVSDKLIEYTKERVRRGVLNAIYGDLLDPLYELESVALMNVNSDPVKIRASIDRIHAIIEGRE